MPEIETGEQKRVAGSVACLAGDYWLDHSSAILSSADAREE